jgi:hypothetical protein
MDAKKKRTRKTTKQDPEVPTPVVNDPPKEEAVEDTEGSEGDEVDKKKRGRKPKSVYSTVDVVPVQTGNASAASDDENVIVRLQVKESPSVPEDENGKNDDHPYAYNRDNYSNISNVNNDEVSRESEVITTNGLKIVDLLKDFEQKNKNKEWPTNTSICCYWCCNKFENTPVGIPVNYSSHQFEVFGCFCSLECAAAHNFKMNDSFDEVWERHNLINLLARKLGVGNMIKAAPDRMSLKMFGGFLDIDAFRKYTTSGKLININFPPMTSLTQQIEEVNEYELNNDLKYIPIDHDRINKYKEKMMFKRAKPLVPQKSSLESTMNLKIN